jgi:c-di-GMP-binding flagellar brake protein YcgR
MKSGETDPGRLAEFRLENPIEIQAVLRDLAKHNAPLAIFSPDSNDPYQIGRVRAFGQSGIELVVDRDAQPISQIFSNKDMIAVAFLNQFKVQFPFSAIVSSSKPDESLICVSCPNVLYRIQRRSGFRIKPLRSLEAICAVRLDSNRIEPWTIFDLSIVGVGLWLPESAKAPNVGTIWRSCLIQIERTMPVDADLRVAVTTPIKTGSNDTRTLIGCAFLNPPPEVQRMLQRTVIELEHIERKARFVK